MSGQTDISRGTVISLADYPKTCASPEEGPPSPRPGALGMRAPPPPEIPEVTEVQIRM